MTNAGNSASETPLIVDPKQRARNEHWSEQAQAYHEKWQMSRVEGSLYKELEAGLLIELADAREGKTVLDLCSGTGRSTLALAETGAALWGVEAAPGMVERARQNAIDAGLDNVTFVLGDARSLPLLDEMFDAVVGTRFMYMMSSPEKKQIIAEARRVLKPRGTLVLQFNCGFWGIKQELFKLFVGRRPRLKDRYLWPFQAAGLFEGFRVECVVGTKLFRLGLLSRCIGRRAALRLNRILRCPGLSYLSAYALVKATKV